jgi:hypothetical protein
LFEDMIAVVGNVVVGVFAIGLFAATIRTRKGGR